MSPLNPVSPAADYNAVIPVSPVANNVNLPLSPPVSPTTPVAQNTNSPASDKNKEEAAAQKVAEKEGIERAQKAAPLLPTGNQPDGSKIARVDGRLDAVSDAGGRSKSFAYDQQTVKEIKITSQINGTSILERGADGESWSLRHQPPSYGSNPYGFRALEADFKELDKNGRAEADAAGNVTYRYQDGRSHTWQTDGSQVTRDPQGRVAGITNPSGKFSGFDRDENGQINRFAIGNGKTFERQPTTAADAMPLWKADDGSNQTWRGTISAANDGTVRTRDASGERITTRDGKTIVAGRDSYNSVNIDNDGKVHSALDANGRIREANYDKTGKLESVAVFTSQAEQKPQVTYTRSEGNTFVREGNGTRQTGTLEFEKNGDLKFTDAATQTTVVDKASGASHVFDAQGRLQTVRQADGGQLALKYDNQGLSAMRETLPDGRSTHWKRSENGWRVGATEAEAESNRVFAGKINVNKYSGTVHIEGKAQDLYLTDKGQTVVHDKATNVETTLDREGRVRHVLSRNGWKFDYDEKGLSAVTFNASTANQNKFVRGENDVWTNERGETWKGKAEVRGDRLLFEEKDRNGKRVISEEIFANGQRRTYKPDEDSRHKYLEEQRNELVKQGKLPEGVTVGQYHESLHLRSQARLGYVNAQLSAHRNNFNTINLPRRGETPLGKEIIADNKNIEDRSRELKKYLENGDYQAFESKFNEYFPETGKTANGLPVLQPFVDVDRKIAEFKNEKPSFEQIALSAANGAIDKIEGMGKAIKEHPEYLLLAAPAFIPVVGWYYAAGLAIAGTAAGGYEVGRGLYDVGEGYANNNHQQIYKGTHDVAGGGVDLAMAFWGRPRGNAPKFTGDAATPPQSPPLTAAAEAAPPNAALPKASTAPKTPDYVIPERGPNNLNRRTLNEQLNDAIKQRANRDFGEFRNTLENSAANGNKGKTPLNGAQPEPALVGATPKPKQGTNVEPPPKPTEKPVLPESTAGVGSSTGSAKSLNEFLQNQNLSKEQIKAVEKVVQNSEEITNALKIAEKDAQTTERINRLIAQTAKNVDAVTDPVKFTETVLSSLRGGKIPYSLEKDAGTIAEVIAAAKGVNPKTLTPGQVNKAILEKAYPEFAKIFEKLDRPEFAGLKKQIERVLAGDKPDGKGGFAGDKLNFKLDRKFDGAREELMGHLNEVIGRNLKTAEERNQFLQLLRDSGTSPQGINTNAGSIGEHFFYQNLLGGKGFEKAKLPVRNGTVDPDFGLNQGILGNIKTVGDTVTPSKFGDLESLFGAMKTVKGRQEIQAALKKAHGDEAAAGFAQHLDSYVFHIQGNGKASLADVEAAAQATLKSAETYLGTITGGTRGNPPIRVTFEGKDGKIYEVTRAGKDLVTKEVGNSISELQPVRGAAK